MTVAPDDPTPLTRAFYFQVPAHLLGVWGFFCQRGGPLNKPEEAQRRARQLASTHADLIDYLDERYSTAQLPDINASERDIGGWIAERRLVATLKKLRADASVADRKVIGG